MKWLRSTDICVKMLAKVNSLHKTVAYFESVWSYFSQNKYVISPNDKVVSALFI